MLFIVSRWRWHHGQLWMPGMGRGTGPWSIYQQEVEQQRKDGSAGRTTKRKEASTWASTQPQTSSSPWNSPNRLLPVPPSPLSPRQRQPQRLQESWRWRPLQLSSVHLPLLLLLMFPPLQSKLATRCDDCLVLVPCDFLIWSGQEIPLHGKTHK